MKAYDEYKATNYDWLPQIPAHWKWLYLSQTCKEQCVRNIKKSVDAVLSLSYGNIIRKKDINFGLVPKDYAGYQIVNEGNIILRLTDLQNDHTSLRTGLVKQTGIITSAYTCIKPFENSAYLQLLLHSYDTQKVFYGMGGGVRQSIGFNEIRSLCVPLPPRSEQDQIVRFLDWKVAMINAYIKAKKRQIELLKEQKQAIINQAVTKGLNPDVPMKDSGIDWLGKIPAGWEVVSLRRIAQQVKTGGTPMGTDEQYFDDDGFNWFTPGDFSDSIYLTASTRKLSKIGINTVINFPPNTVYIIGIGATLGKVAVSKNPSACNQQLNAIVCKKKYNAEFLAFYLKSIRTQVFNTAKYTTLPILNQEETKNIAVPLINIETQNEIVVHLLDIEANYKKVFDNLEKAIFLLQEYRTRLISDVVTGKVDVRGVRVPEVERTPEVVAGNGIDEEAVEDLC
ncbi:MAG: restriction endonuclease subunit S [Termitinemataceae bacterium]|nr:MAG: restriction endonuclease subunit S [Termitinemataceae bacterium]